MTKGQPYRARAEPNSKNNLKRLEPESSRSQSAGYVISKYKYQHRPLSVVIESTS